MYRDIYAHAYKTENSQDKSAYIPINSSSGVAKALETWGECHPLLYKTDFLLSFPHLLFPPPTPPPPPQPGETWAQPAGPVTAGQLQRQVLQQGPSTSSSHCQS